MSADIEAARPTQKVLIGDFMVFIKSISPKPSYIEPPGPLIYMFMSL